MKYFSAVCFVGENSVHFNEQTYGANRWHTFPYDIFSLISFIKEETRKCIRV
jgi:hypothetical protein